MSYEKFAYIYDYLMTDTPYAEWMNFLAATMAEFSCEGDRVLELACGTGELSVLLSAGGYEVTGVDLSEDMLMMAREKAEAKGVPIAFYQQDMSTLEGLGMFDAAVLFCDSLNYLSGPDQVLSTFKRVHDHLKSGGLFLFDVHSTYKVDKLFIDHTFALDDEKVSYIWNSFAGEEPHSVEHELSFFVRSPDGRYDRFEECHYQRTYITRDIEQWLLEAGFEVLKITADFTGQPPGPESERIFFACRKR